MANELTYALITPYSLLKSRTGGVIARLLALCNLDLVAARMYAPSDALAEEFARSFAEETEPAAVRGILADYVRGTFPRRNRFGISNRCMVLLFEGENAVQHLSDVVGPISAQVSGNTVRGTYGDFVRSQGGEVAFFEPAVLAPTTPAQAERQLRLLKRYARSDGGLLTHVLEFPAGANVEATLVIIKPDNFVKRSSLPGNIIDIFSRTGLYIVAAKVLHMTVPQAEEFYRPVRQAFIERLAPVLEARLRSVLAEQFPFRFPEDAIRNMARAGREAFAEHEFRRIVNYMAGVETGAGAESRGKCFALLYQGVDAIRKVRQQLGATNPEAADAGTVRSIYGQDLMKNGAHASDSPSNAERERRIIGLWEESGPSEFESVIAAHVGD